MKHTALYLKDQYFNARKWDSPYKALRKHLNAMPVGMPATPSGVERKILKDLFDIEEARLALFLDWRYQTADTIFDKAGVPLNMSQEDVTSMLSVLEKKGAIAAREKDGGWEFALHPLIIGMYEMQVARQTSDMYANLRKYALPIFAIEYLTSAVPQMRVIPVEKSITPDHNISTYDEIRTIIENATTDMCIAECICKKAKAQMGEPCKVTERKEFCLGLGDFGAQFVRNGWARPISKEDAMEHLTLCEKEGLVIQPSNAKNPEYFCLCCGCCCGILEMMRSMPRPADFCASNFHVTLSAESCNGCGKCVKRCTMNAFTLKNNKKDKKAVLDPGKCIGCGLCVTTCKTEALKLVKKDTETVPPENMEEKFQIMLDGKKGAVGKLWSAGKGVLGLKP